MSSLTVHPIDGEPWLAWRDGVPLLTPELLSIAEEWIGEPLGLTPEGPYFPAGWETIEAAAVLLLNVVPRVTIEADPSLARYYERSEGSV